MTAEKPRRLGRGLDALIPAANTSDAEAAAPGADLTRVPIARIRPNPFQPRRDFDTAALAELESSLKASGLLQPITVRRRGDVYELVTGERRLRAATNIGWTEIPAVVRDFDEQTMLVLALVENLQRTDLNAIEEARGYRRLVGEFNLTQQQIAEAVGKDRTSITNLLRLLSLPESVQRMVEERQLSTGHARALLALASIDAAVALATEAVTRGLSVRELERRVRELGDAKAAQTRSTPAPRPDAVAPSAADEPAARRVEDELRRYLQTDVHLQLTGDAKGHLRIAFYSHDDLDRLMDLIMRNRQPRF